MNWLPIVLIAYFVLAISALVDKFLVSKVFTHAMIYVMWVSFLSLGAFLLIPGYPSLGLPAVSWIGWGWFWISLLTGAIFTGALWLMYTALQRGEASRVIPFIGGAVPIIIFLISLIFELETFSQTKILAFALLITGSILITIMPNKRRKIARFRGMLTSTAASLAFAIFFLLTRFIFDAHNFVDGLVWPRVGTLVVLIVLLFFHHNRELLIRKFRKLSPKLRFGIISNQGLAAIGFLGQQYAIDLGGSLSLITALQGIQYAFILIFAAIATWKFPKMIEEKISKKIIIQKVLALGLIIIGLYFISI